MPLLATWEKGAKLVRTVQHSSRKRRITPIPRPTPTPPTPLRAAPGAENKIQERREEEENYDDVDGETVRPSAVAGTSHRRGKEETKPEKKEFSHIWQEHTLQSGGKAGQKKFLQKVKYLGDAPDIGRKHRFACIGFF